MRQFAVALLFIVSTGAAFAQSASWDHFEDGGAIYAGTIDDRKNAIEIYCTNTGVPTLLVKSPQFRVSVPDGHRYTLNFITAQGRVQLMAKAKDAEVLHEAKDLNEKVTLQRLAQDISTSPSFTVAMMPFGWKVEFTGEGAAEALKGVLGGCL